MAAEARAAFRDKVTEVFVSAASLWEIAIKRRKGQLTAPDNLPDLISGMGHQILDVRLDHAWHVRTLPLLHGDPFDRLIVAQAQVENLTLVTHDRRLFDYDVRIIRA